MSIQDPISDMLTRVRNALKAGFTNVVMPSSNIKVAIVEILKQEGYISDYKIIDKSVDVSYQQLSINLKYFEDNPAIDKIKRISKPSLRRYCSNDNIPSVKAGLGIAIISTSRGLMTDRVARKSGLGGEIICEVI